ncbi:hypothetical protein QIY50_11880 [Pseudomonas putida]|nr:hypothetical protein QIY50_11880 [Pseudomonas putida]
MAQAAMAGVQLQLSLQGVVHGLLQAGCLAQQGSQLSGAAFQGLPRCREQVAFAGQ